MNPNGYDVVLYTNPLDIRPEKSIGSVPNWWEQVRIRTSFHKSMKSISPNSIWIRTNKIHENVPIASPFKIRSPRIFWRSLPRQGVAKPSVAGNSSSSRSSADTFQHSNHLWRGTSSCIITLNYVKICTRKQERDTPYLVIQIRGDILCAKLRVYKT